jgi:hypothetical protein
MSVVALQALALRAHLQQHTTRQPVRFCRQIGRIVDVPWNMATGGDLSFPKVVGRRTMQMRLLNTYLNTLLAAAAHDPWLGRAIPHGHRACRPAPGVAGTSVIARVRRAPDGHRGHRGRIPTTATDIPPTPARRLNLAANLATATTAVPRHGRPTPDRQRSHDTRPENSPMTSGKLIIAALMSPVSTLTALVVAGPATPSGHRLSVAGQPQPDVSRLGAAPPRRRLGRRQRLHHRDATSHGRVGEPRHPSRAAAVGRRSRAGILLVVGAAVRLGGGCVMTIPMSRATSRLPARGARWRSGRPRPSPVSRSRSATSRHVGQQPTSGGSFPARLL